MLEHLLIQTKLFELIDNRIKVNRIKKIPYKDLKFELMRSIKNK